jgi:hypothetical protein
MPLRFLSYVLLDPGVNVRAGAATPPSHPARARHGLLLPTPLVDPGDRAADRWGTSPPESRMERRGPRLFQNCSRHLSAVEPFASSIKVRADPLFHDENTFN